MSIRLRRECCDFQRVQTATGVPITDFGQKMQRFVVNLDPMIPKPTLLIRQGPFH
jgi:hypothetical protein